ncbi:MAG: hypothetical protein JW806_03865 [Sedimentisphaerales bacterium]|nr:hypothetical protein [Sedimentisphaerales bacterium]
MDNKSILDDLFDVLEKQNVKIRKDCLGSGGSGLCKIKGQNVFFADMDSSTYEIAVCCARALAEVVDIESIYLKPQVRSFIEQNTDFSHEDTKALK